MPTLPRFSRLSTAGVVLLPLLVAGCSGGKLSPTKAKAATVVEVGAAKLSGEQLAGWLAQAPAAPTAISAALLVSTWLDQTMLDQAVRQGMPLDDSATVDLAITPDAVRGMLLDFWERRAKARPPVTNAQADSLFDLDRVRVFQQLFVALPQQMDSAAAAPIVARVKSLAIRAHTTGVDFTSLVRETSKDSAVLARNGFMPAMTREDVPGPVSAAIWALRPSEVSGILGSNEGAHLFRRASREESRTNLKIWLAPQLALRAEQRFLDSTTAALGLTYPADAVVRVRAMAPEPMAMVNGGPLATWKGGELKAATVRSWVAMLAPNERALLASTSDSAATRFLRELAQREILLAISSPVPAPNAEARTALVPQFRQALDTAKNRLASVSTGSPAGGAGSAYIDAVLSQRIFYRPLPGALAGILRSRMTATVNAPALEGVIAAANTEWREKHANDTAAVAPKRPAPNGPLDRMVPNIGGVPIIEGSPPKP